MRNKLLLSLLFIFAVSFNALAQVEEFNFGDISIDDLQMQHYAPDSGAVAVYLLDKGSAYMNQNDGNMFLDVHVRIKILKEEGLEFGNVSLRYIRGSSDISRLKASTYNLVDGKVVETEVKRKDWLDETITDDLKEKKVSFPDVRVGSIIEYSYTKKAGNLINLPGWVFQAEIPVRYSEFYIKLPSYGKYQQNFQGYISPAYREFNADVNHLVMKDVPALKREPYISTLENYRSRIGYEIKSLSLPGYATETYMSNWDEINKTLYESETLGDVFYNTGTLRQIYPEDKGWSANKEDLIEIYEYIRDHFKWNERNSYHVVDRSKKLWEEAEGDNADINMTLGQFLNKAGFTVSPVVLSTRRHGYINPIIPLVRQFNYLLVCVELDGEKILLDATDKFRPYNTLPARVMNGNGLLLGKTQGQWISLNNNNERDAKTVSGEFSLNEDDVLQGKININFDGLAASRIREGIYEKLEKASTTEASDEEDEGDDEDLEEYQAGEIENLEVQNGDNPNETLKVSYDFTIEENPTVMGDKIFLSPVILKTAKENPFKLETRLYPVELPAPVSDTYIFNFQIPDGYEVEEIPASQNLALPNGGGRYMFVTGVQGNTVQLMIRLQLQKTQYLPEEYPALRELFNLIVMKQEEQVILKKKVE